MRPKANESMRPESNESARASVESDDEILIDDDDDEIGDPGSHPLGDAARYYPVPLNMADMTEIGICGFPCGGKKSEWKYISTRDPSKTQWWTKLIESSRSNIRLVAVWDGDPLDEKDEKTATSFTVPESLLFAHSKVMNVLLSNSLSHDVNSGKSEEKASLPDAIEISVHPDILGFFVDSMLSPESIFVNQNWDEMIDSKFFEDLMEFLHKYECNILMKVLELHLKCVEPTTRLVRIAIKYGLYQLLFQWRKTIVQALMMGGHFNLDCQDQRRDYPCKPLKCDDSTLGQMGVAEGCGKFMRFIPLSVSEFPLEVVPMLLETSIQTNCETTRCGPYPYLPRPVRMPFPYR